MDKNKEIDLFCIDCDKITRQKYKGILADGSHLFICKECGCENTAVEDNKDFRICDDAAFEAATELVNA